METWPSQHASPNSKRFVPWRLALAERPVEFHPAPIAAGRLAIRSRGKATTFQNALGRGTIEDFGAARLIDGRVENTAVGSYPHQQYHSARFHHAPRFLRIGAGIHSRGGGRSGC